MQLSVYELLLLSSGENIIIRGPVVGRPPTRGGYLDHLHLRPYYASLFFHSPLTLFDLSQLVLCNSDGMLHKVSNDLARGF